MSVDKLVDSTQLDSDLTSVANAIRTKSGGSSQLAFPLGFVSEIESIPTGGSPTGTKQISINQNGTTTENVADYASAEINVNVPASAVDSGTKSISSNGTHDVTGYASASVAVPNSYSSGDEGKVVSNGALVAQTSDTVTQNGTVDTTLINSLLVNVSGGDEPLIPSIYQRVEYIAGSGSGAVIDTGFVPTENTSAILKFVPLVVTGDAFFGTMGILSGDKDKWRVFNYSSSFYFDCGAGNTSARLIKTSWLPVDTQRYVSIGNTWIIDMTTGQEVAGAEARTFTDPITTNIFINGGAQNKSANAKWYDVKIFDDGDMVRDFVPCYRIADDVVGLYDRVTATFFTNRGSGGTFIAGPDVISANDLIVILLGGAS